MVKNTRKKIIIMLIICMLIQLLGGMSLLAEEAVGLPPAESAFVPLLDVTLSPGETAGATSATINDPVSGSLLINVTEEEIARPRVGDTAPTAGDNLLADYESGSDITVGVAACICQPKTEPPC